MKRILILLPVLISTLVEAQTIETLDTIYANDSKNVSLFFPEPIRQGITGSENFVFTYNREKEQYFGLLQAKPGKESNLLVINRNGAIFSYIIRYKAQLSKLNYFIPLSNSIGNEKPKMPELTQTKFYKEHIDNRTYHYQKFCSYLLDKKQYLGRYIRRKDGVILRLENIVFDKEELYFVIQIKNNSTLDFDLNFLSLSTESRQKGKKKSVQRLYLKPNFVHNLPTKIIENETERFIYVMPKFSLSNDHRVILELNEKDGERNIEMKISHKYINNPN